MQTHAVIFDLFGTLVDNLRIPDYDRVMHEVAVVLGADPGLFLKAWVACYPQRAIGDPATLAEGIQQISAAIGVQPTTDQVEQAAQLRVQFTRETLATRPESATTLARIRELGLPTCLISDCTWEVPMLWDRSVFAPLFNAAIFSCSVGIKKPDPRIYRLACDALGVDPTDCLYVGDGCSEELTGATELGMRAVQILCPHEHQEFYGMHSRQQWDGPLISSIREILDMLE